MSYRRLNLTNFRGFKLDPAFTAFSHDNGSSNSGLDGFVDSWPPEIHISWRIARSHKHSLEQMVPKSALCEGSATARLGVRDFEIHWISSGFRISEWISGFQSGFRISEWISGFQSGFLDFKVDFWISKRISGFQSGFLEGFLDFKRISGFQSGFLDFKVDFSRDFWI